MLKYEIWKQAMFIMIQDGCGIEPPLARSRQGKLCISLRISRGKASYICGCGSTEGNGYWKGKMLEAALPFNL